MTKQEDTSSKIKFIVSFITILALGFFVFAIRGEIVQTYRDIQRINIVALAVVPFALLLKYHALTQMHRGILEFFNERIRYRSMFRVQLELNMVNNVFPSGGVTGISYFGLRMRDADVSVGKSTLVQVLKFVLVFISFQALLALGLLMLAATNSASSLLILIAGSLSTLLFVVTLLLGYILSSKKQINAFFTWLSHALNRIVRFFRRDKNPEFINVENVKATFTDLHESYLRLKRNKSALKKPLMYALLVNTAEIIALYAVYLAFGSVVNPGAIIIAFAVANFAGLISILPGGIGIYEALMTGSLVAAGVPAAVSLPVTIMYRIVTSFLQLIPGYYYYHKNLMSRKPVQESAGQD